MSEIEVFIEIPKGSKVKYEHDNHTNIIHVDRILQSAYVYPYNYGYIPNTLSEDGDPIDVMVLGDYSLIPGCSIKCRVIGALMTYDNSNANRCCPNENLVSDPKIIAVPIDSIDPSFKDIKDVPNNTRHIIQDFFSNYKNNEPNKKVLVTDWLNYDEALNIINQV